MRGIGEVLSGPIVLPPLPAVLVNPGVALATKSVFARWKPMSSSVSALDAAAIGKLTDAKELVRLLAAQSNDLEAPAIGLQPVVADVLAALRALGGCGLARMSGSGATCFGLFASADEAAAAEKLLSIKQPGWWVKATTLGGV